MLRLQPPLNAQTDLGAGYEVQEDRSQLNVAQKDRRRALIVPREHGAWGMLLMPLATGAAVGLFSGGSLIPVLLLTITVLALFWLRTPLESWLGSTGIRVQSREERQIVRAVVLPLATVASAALIALGWGGKNRELIWLGIIATAAFAVQHLLRSLGRSTRMAAEMVGALALTSTAPAAYYVASGRLDAKAWMLWLLNWLFAADQVHFVWLRLRGIRASGPREKFTAGWTFLAGNLFFLGILALVYHFIWLPTLALIAFVPIFLRGLVWFLRKPQPMAIRRLGWTELAHALLFGILLAAGLSFAR
ncbi:MAG: YwiC-like family protein [Candidatus Sulfotelmatobacter sp.]